MPRVGLKVLQEKWGQGGLALPDWRKYYLASQVILVHRWLVSNSGDSAMVLEDLGLYESLCLAIHRGIKLELLLTASMKATMKACETAVRLACPSYQGFSPSTPLLMNPKLPQFYSFEDPMGWLTKGVKLLKDITRDGELTFYQLKSQA